MKSPENYFIRPDDRLVDAAPLQHEISIHFMYTTLLIIHSCWRWLVLGSLVISIFRAYSGWKSGHPFSGSDNALRHWTATIAHIQLVLGVTLYIKSPVIQYFFAHIREIWGQKEIWFFGALHFILMLLAVVILTIGSALAKRRATEREQFKTMFTWFTVALLLILVAVPWPFSPLAARPYFRNF